MLSSRHCLATVTLNNLRSHTVDVEITQGVGRGPEIVVKVSKTALSCDLQ